MGIRGISCAAIAVGALALAGCSHESADWKSAAAANTTEAYRQFLQQHPNGADAPQARARIQQLEEDRDWQAAAAADTRDAYQQFVAQHPESKWSQEARIRIENFAQTGVTPGAAAAAASSAATAGPAGANAAAAAAAAPRTPAKSAPGSTAARASAAVRPPAGKQAAAAAPSNLVQLGAFRSRQRAQTEWRRLSARFPSEFKSLQPRYVPGTYRGQRVYRLQVAVSSAASARGLCATLKKHSLACVPVTA